MNIFVGSLSFKTTEEELQREFEAFGEVDSVKIIVDQATLRSRGFAFVTMPNTDQAQAAIAGMNGKELNGFTLKVNEARPRESRGPRPERTGGGYGSSPRSNPGFSSGGASGGGRRDRDYGSFDKGNNIYDTKSGRSGGFDRRGGGGGRGGRGGSGGRSGGGRGSY